MTDLHLSKVRIKDFRSFGEFEADIPAGPGLTLVVGTNGLGKSSFFDAIEWALSGKVQRLLGYVPAKTGEAAYLRQTRFAYQSLWRSFRSSIRCDASAFMRSSWKASGA